MSTADEYKKACDELESFKCINAQVLNQYADLEIAKKWALEELLREHAPALGILAVFDPRD